MKRIQTVWSLLIVLALTISLLACGDTDKPTVQEPSAPSVQQEETVPESEPEVQQEAAIQGLTANKQTFVYDSYELIEDYEGNPALRTYWYYTNNSDENEAWGWNFSVNYYQNGIEINPLDHIFISMEDNDKADATNMDEIMPGVTAYTSSTIVLKDSSPVTVVVEEYLSFSHSDSYTFVIDLK